jgi:hypothetical protein
MIRKLFIGVFARLSGKLGMFNSRSEMYTGYKDKNGRKLYIGDRFRVQPDGVIWEAQLICGRDGETLVARDLSGDGSHIMGLIGFFIGYDGLPDTSVVVVDGLACT